MSLDNHVAAVGPMKVKEIDDPAREASYLTHHARDPGYISTPVRPPFDDLLFRSADERLPKVLLRAVAQLSCEPGDRRQAFFGPGISGTEQM